MEIRGCIDYLINMIFPARCPVCQEIVVPCNHKICKKCEGVLGYVEEPYCLKCGRPLKQHDRLCNDCMNNRMEYEEGRSVFVYDDTMRKSIYAFKYNKRKEYAKFYGEQVERRLDRKIRDWKADALIPIPLHPDRINKRGYNQSYLLAKEIGRLMNLPVLEHGLIRVKNTEAQKKLSRDERENNLKKAFKTITFGVKLDTVILVDDIYTTGSTINEAAKCLKEAGVKRVFFIVLSIGKNI